MCDSSEMGCYVIIDKFGLFGIFHLEMLVNVVKIPMCFKQK